MPGLTPQSREERQCAQPSIQYRPRGKGKKARYLKAAEVAKFRAAIVRGKQLRQLEREQQRLQEQLQPLAAQTKELGLALPESA